MRSPWRRAEKKGYMGRVGVCMGVGEQGGVCKCGGVYGGGVVMRSS